MCTSYRKSFPQTYSPFFCGAAWQLIVEVFPCLLCQANKCRWATGEEAQQTCLAEKESSSKALPLRERPPFSPQVGGKHGVYAGRSSKACGLPTRGRAAGEFGDGGGGPRTARRERSVWGESLLRLRSRTGLCLPGPNLLLCKFWASLETCQKQLGFSDPSNPRY